MLEHPARREPERILRGGRFGRRLVWAQPDPRAVVRMTVEVERTVRAVGSRIVSGVVAPFGLVAVYHGPHRAGSGPKLCRGRQALLRLLLRAAELLPDRRFGRG